MIHLPHRPEFHPKVHVMVAATGIASAVFAITEAIIKLSAGQRPSLDDTTTLVHYMMSNEVPILLVVLADTLLMATLVVFFAALRYVIKRRSERPEWVSDIGFGAILVYAAITLVGDSMDGGTVLDTTLSQGNAIVIRTLIESHILLFGPIGSVLIVLTAATFGYALLCSSVAPRWTAVAAYAVAGANAIAIPMVFHNISAVAYGTEVTLGALALFIAWILATGIAVGRTQARE